MKTLERLHQRDEEIHEQQKKLYEEHRQVTLETAKLGGYKLRVVGNNAFFSTPCVLNIAHDCRSGEDPGWSMAVLGDGWNWVCDPCAEIAQPGIGEDLKKVQKEAEEANKEAEEVWKAKQRDPATYGK
jgi:hypothetical protein